jgi:hypothetical protein
MRALFSSVQLPNAPVEVCIGAYKIDQASKGFSFLPVATKPGDTYRQFCTNLLSTFTRCFFSLLSSLSHSTCTHSSSSTMTTTADKPRSKEEWVKADDGLEIFTKTWYSVDKPVATVVFVHGLGEHIVRKLSLVTDSHQHPPKRMNDHSQPIFMSCSPIQWIL